jgi:trehalose utilization protein
MNRLPLYFSLILSLGLGLENLPAQRNLNVLVYAEGYRYGKAAFELAEMFNARPDSMIKADFTNTESILNPESLDGYDVLVLFNHNNIAQIHEKNITEFVARGKGLVALHHVINKANDNPELTRLVGGYYTVEDGAVMHKDFHIMRIPGKEHPILSGIPESFPVKNDQDFQIKFYPGQIVDRLLTCDITGNGPQEDSGWTRTEGAGRVVFLSPGDAVEEKPFLTNEPVTRLIVNSILWASGR